MGSTCRVLILLELIFATQETLMRDWTPAADGIG
jgi:hypothetical protein